MKTNNDVQLEEYSDFRRLTSLLGRGGGLMAVCTKLPNYSENPKGTWKGVKAWFDLSKPLNLNGLEKLAQSFEIYFSPATFKTQNRTNEAVASVSGLWGDFDAKDFEFSKAAALAHIEALGLPPTIVVDSGWGYQPYWVFSKPVLITEVRERSRMQRLQIDWINHIGADGNAKNLCGVLRIPGTLNHKPRPLRKGEERRREDFQPPILVKVVDGLTDWSRSYTLDEFDQHLVTPPSQEEVQSEGGLPHTSRHLTLLSVGGKLLREGVTSEELREGLIEYNQIHFELPLPVAEVDKMWRKTLKYDSKDYLREFRFDDVGNVRCLERMFGEKFKWMEGAGWMVWTPRVWISTKDASKAAVFQKVDEMLRLRREAVQLDKNIEPKTLTDLLGKLISSTRHIRPIIEAWQAWSVVDQSEFEPNPKLLNCANGYVELGTGELHQPGPNHRFTYCLDTEYRSDADSSVWLEFLRSVLPAKNLEEGLSYLQLAVGYTLTGYGEEHITFNLLGPESSGKTTFLETLFKLLRPLAWAIDFEVLTRKKGYSSKDFSTVYLKDKRFVMASEPDKSKRINESIWKRGSGADTLHGDVKYGAEVNFSATHKLWIASNDELNLDPDSTSSWGRLRVIPFPNPFEDKSKKKIWLPRQLREPTALEGLLAWAVQGAIRWGKLGESGMLGVTPPFVQRATEAARLTVDSVAQWWEEEGIWTGDPDDSVTRVLCYNRYKAWCKRSGEFEPVSKNMFFKAMMGGEKKRPLPGMENLPGKKRSSTYGRSFTRIKLRPRTAQITKDGETSQHEL